jgi:hypothetical protein
MSLYARVAKPFEHVTESTSDDSDDDLMSSNTKTKGKNNKQPLKRQKVSEVKSNPSIVEIDSGDEEEDEAEIKRKREEAAEKFISDTITAAEPAYVSTPPPKGKAKGRGKAAKAVVPVEVVDVEDEVEKKAREQLQKLTAAKQVQKQQENELYDVEDLTVEPIVPVVQPKRSGDRVSTNNTVVGEFSMDTLQRLVGGGKTATTTSSSSSSAAPPRAATKPFAPPIKLITRLNGRHEWKWQISMKDTFSKVSLCLCVCMFITIASLYIKSQNLVSVMYRIRFICVFYFLIIKPPFFSPLQIRVKFAEIYGLPQEALKFEVDGNKLGYEDTPESLELNDDDLIDVKVRGDICCLFVVRFFGDMCGVERLFWFNKLCGINMFMYCLLSYDRWTRSYMTQLY